MKKGYIIWLRNRVNRIKHAEAVVANSRYIATIKALEEARKNNPKGDFEVWEIKQG